MTVRTDEEFTEMFDQTWRYLSENFYDVKFHGHDWDAVRAKYRPLVKHVAMKEDLYALLYLMMGELNASHLGVGGYATTPEEQTAELGLVWDEAYRGKGLKVLDVLKRGPADRRGLSLKPGEFVLAIDGVEVTEATDLSQLLNGKVGETVELQVAADPNADPKARRRVEVQAIARGDMRTENGVAEGVRSLMYDRWVDEQRQAGRGAERAASWATSTSRAWTRTGWSAFCGRSTRTISTRRRSCWTCASTAAAPRTTRCLNYLMGHGHTLFRQRDGREGTVVEAGDRKWNKPLVLLINNRSYSDAEMFPNAFRTLGLGKLVGQPTGGYVIGTGQVQLIDGSILRIPRIGVYTPTGVDMDKEGVRPDVLVEPHPDQLAKGRDVQLDKAVEVLQAEVAEWKKAHPSAVAVGPDGAEAVARPDVGAAAVHADGEVRRASSL